MSDVPIVCLCFFPGRGATGMRFQTRASLILRLRNLDDVAAWREFAAGYGPFIRRVGFEAGTSSESLPDLVQDVLLTVVRVIPRFAYDPSRGRFRSWLARIVRSRSGDLARKTKRDAALKSRLSDDPLRRRSFDIEESRSGTGVLQAAVELVRATARPQTWSCFEKHVLQGERAADVANELKTTLNAVYLNSARLMKRVEFEAHRILEQGQGHEARTLSAGR
jgi:RNA polymerase sigma-70 factor, ECF subfamily